jgi:hypothetical protein
VFTVERLGAYAGNALAARDTAKVDQHLAGCTACRDRLAELDDLAPRLRRAALPIPIGLAALTVGKWQLTGATHAAAAAAHGGRSLVQAQRALAVASASLLALGVCSTFVVSRDLDRAGQHALDRGRGDTAQTVVLGSDNSRSSTVPSGQADAAGITGPDIARALGETLTTDQVISAGSDGAGSAGAGATPAASGQPGNPPTHPASPPKSGPQSAAKPTAQVSAAVSVAAPLMVVVSAGAGPGSCSGVAIAGQGGGCTPPPPASSPAIAVDAGGEGLPPIHLGLP